MKSTLKLVGILAVSTLAVAPMSARVSSPPQTTAAKAVTQPTDKSITDRIEKRVDADVSLKKYGIDVRTDDGVVMLKGTVATEAQKSTAGRLAKVTGVSKVDNQIAVDPNARPNVVTRLAKAGAEKTKDGVMIAVDKTKAGLSKTGEVITDAWITTKVKTTFVGEELLKDSDINADTADHVVTLKGTVLTAAGRTRAVTLTKQVEGVKLVINNLTIGPKK